MGFKVAGTASVCLLSKPEGVSQSFRSKQLLQQQNLKCFLSHLMYIVKLGPIEMITMPINYLRLHNIMYFTFLISVMTLKFNF